MTSGKNPCKRKCWNCGNVAMHTDDVTPDVCCQLCGSQDTRLVREKEPNVGPIYGVELIDTLPLGNGGMLQAMPNRDDLRAVARSNERVAAGYEVLLAHYVDLKQKHDAASEELEQLRQANTTMLEGIKYWSYCMSEGMRATAPEKCSELMDFLIKHNVAPYYRPEV